MNRSDKKESILSVAVIGLAGRFPQAKNLTEFWQNLKRRKDCITFFSDEELLRAGTNQAELHNKNYIKAKGIISGIENFDADFFGYLPKEAELLDPQIRLIHECAYEAWRTPAIIPDAIMVRLEFMSVQKIIIFG